MDPEKLRQELLTSLRAAIAPLERRMGQDREIAALVVRLKQLLNTLETRPDAIEVLLQMHAVPKQTGDARRLFQEMQTFCCTAMKKKKLFAVKLGSAREVLTHTSAIAGSGE